MSGRSVLPPPVKALAAEASARWQALPGRERTGLSLAALALGVLLLWLSAVAPALRTLRETPVQLAALELQLQSMQRLAAEAGALRREAPVPTAQAAAALKSATERLGEKARINIQGDRATLTLTGVSGDALRAWLTEARSGARARPVEAKLARGAQGYSGTLTLTLGGAS